MTFLFCRICELCVDHNSRTRYVIQSYIIVNMEVRPKYLFMQNALNFRQGCNRGGISRGFETRW